jgi:hypothetical protein
LSRLFKNEGSESLKKTVLNKTHSSTTQQELSNTENSTDTKKNQNFERLSHSQIMSHASKIWGPQRSETDLIIRETAEIISLVKKRKSGFFSGKSEKGILSGIFYLLAMKNRILIAQRQIARRLDTTDVTVRGSYHDWIDNFPEFFPAKTHHTHHGSSSI